MSIRSTLKKEAYLVVAHRSHELKTEILAEVDQHMTALETHLMNRMNEDRQTTANRLQEINELVAAVRDGQQRIWGAIERISKDLQELIQRDVGIDGEDEADPAPATTNLDAAE